MRKIFTFLWLLCLLGMWVYVSDKGDMQRRREKAYEKLLVIQEKESKPNPNMEEILKDYDELTRMLPANENPKILHQIRLARIRIRVDCYDFINAIDDGEELLDEVADKYGPEAQLTRATRENLARAYYLLAYTLRSMSVPEKEWRPYGERARQIYRYLAEHDDLKALSEYESKVNGTVNKMVRRY